MPSREQFLDSLHRDAELFEAAVRAGGDLTQPVDGCPEWDLGALVEHLGTLQRYITAGIESGGKPTGGWPSAPEDRARFADWFAEGAAALEAALRARPDDEACWTFFPNAPQTIGTWVRRQAHELAVHRYDAEMAATGVAEALDPAIAVDGIDEYFDLFVPRVDGRTPIRIGELTIHLHAAGDAAGEWLVRCGDHAPAVTREHGKGDVALTGEASDLLLTIWGRVDPEEVGVAVFGEPDVWSRFQAAAAI
ncbi:MAG TPA: maleylpyruvate isomerase N-terminal domain-containing protein [Acidimicrobiales bacterium]|nr:maleylpyruvate isomerase N-terminal domain-containing protein [Acidimicrobiales bacterium]